jgi:hypothetical protein
MSLCEADTNLLPGPCQSQGRWVGPDGKLRCSLHHIQAFGHGSPLIRVGNYEPPAVPEEQPVESK